MSTPHSKGWDHSFSVLTLSYMALLNSALLCTCTHTHTHTHIHTHTQRHTHAKCDIGMGLALVLLQVVHLLDVGLVSFSSL
jgi:hypothetical protein